MLTKSKRQTKNLMVLPSLLIWRKSIKISRSSKHSSNKLITIGLLMLRNTSNKCSQHLVDSQWVGSKTSKIRISSSNYKQICSKSRMKELTSRRSTSNRCKCHNSSNTKWLQVSGFSRIHNSNNRIWWFLNRIPRQCNISSRTRLIRMPQKDNLRVNNNSWYRTISKINSNKWWCHNNNNLVKINLHRISLKDRQMIKKINKINSKSSLKSMHKNNRSLNCNSKSIWLTKARCQTTWTIKTTITMPVNSNNNSSKCNNSSRTTWVKTYNSSKMSSKMDRVFNSKWEWVTWVSRCKCKLMNTKITRIRLSNKTIVCRTINSNNKLKSNKRVFTIKACRWSNRCLTSSKCSRTSKTTKMLTPSNNNNRMYMVATYPYRQTKWATSKTSQQSKLMASSTISLAWSLITNSK